VLTNTFPAVLVLAYARPDGVKRIIEECLRNDVKRIYIAVDGPKSSNQANRQIEILEVVEKFRGVVGTDFFILAQEMNLGVGVGVITGVDWFFSHEPSGHILEDDLVIGPDFFRFSRESLIVFEGDEAVKMISGTQLIPDEAGEAFVNWCNYPMIWGWSTWREDWLQMRSGLLQPKQISFMITGMLVKNYWAIGANRVLDGKVDTWDTPLAAEFYNQGWLCAIPPVNLVSNVGNDLQASHTKVKSEWIGKNIYNLDQELDFSSRRTNRMITSYNRVLEKMVFQIKFRHILLPLYSILWDKLLFKNTMSPLLKRLK
jgi:hypothetical protein